MRPWIRNTKLDIPVVTDYINQDCVILCEFKQRPSQCTGHVRESGQSLFHRRNQNFMSSRLYCKKKLFN